MICLKIMITPSSFFESTFSSAIPSILMSIVFSESLALLAAVVTSMVLVLLELGHILLSSHHVVIIRGYPPGFKGYDCSPPEGVDLRLRASISARERSSRADIDARRRRATPEGGEQS